MFSDLQSYQNDYDKIDMLEDNLEIEEKVASKIVDNFKGLLYVYCNKQVKHMT